MGRPWSLTEDMMDACVKLAFGPRKLGIRETAKMVGISEESTTRVLRTYTLVNEDNTDELAKRVSTRDITMRQVNWAYEYHGKPIPKDFEARVQAAARGVAFPEEQQKDGQAKEKAETDNVLVLCERINALGRAVSDGLTEKTASVLAKEIAAAVKESVEVATDLILKEMEKQTEYLDKIAYNTKKLKKG